MLRKPIGLAAGTGAALLVAAGAAQAAHAPPLLLVAFLTESDHGPGDKLRFSRAGIVAIAIGTLAHLISGARETSGDYQSP